MLEEDQHNNEVWKTAAKRVYGEGAVAYISPSPGPRWWGEEYPASATAEYYRIIDRSAASGATPCISV